MPSWKRDSDPWTLIYRIASIARVIYDSKHDETEWGRTRRLFRALPGSRWEVREAIVMIHRFFSAHFDDGVGSCGGLMARLVRQGEHVILHTVFGGDADPPYSEFAKELHALSGSGDQPGGIRATEDAAVCRVLGCHQEVSRFPDAIYRRDGTGSWLYPNEQALFGVASRG